MTLLALSLLALIAPYDAPETAQHGYASAYAPGVMQEVIEARFLNDWWPNTPRRDWYTAAGYVAGMDCAKVGQMATLVTPDGREWPVLIADCAGNDGPADRFTRNRIIAELDWGLFTRLTALHGRPLEIELR